MRALAWRMAERVGVFKSAEQNSPEIEGFEPRDTNPVT